MAEGVYEGTLELSRSFPPQAPLVIRAATTLAASFPGRIIINGDGYILRGLDLTPTDDPRPRISLVGNHVRVTRCRLRGSDSEDSRGVIGLRYDPAQQGLRIDRCEISDFVGNAIAINGRADKDLLIDHNHIHSGRAGRNEDIGIYAGGEITSRPWRTADITYNLFERLAKQAFEVKGSHNLLYRNTVRRCRSAYIRNGFQNQMVANHFTEVFVHMRDWYNDAIGNRMVGSKNFSLWSGNYDPAAYTLTMAPRRADLGVSPRPAALWCRLIGNDFDGEVLFGDSTREERQQPVPARNDVVVLHRHRGPGSGLVDFGPTFSRDNSYRPDDPAPSGITVPDRVELGPPDVGPGRREA